MSAYRYTSADREWILNKAAQETIGITEWVLTDPDAHTRPPKLVFIGTDCPVDALLDYMEEHADNALTMDREAAFEEMRDFQRQHAGVTLGMIAFVTLQLGRAVLALELATMAKRDAVKQN